MSTPGIPVENKVQPLQRSTCCTYMTEALGPLRSKADFDHVLWQISHEHIEVYRDQDGWYLLIRGHCEHLQPGGACGIYEQRLQVCRLQQRLVRIRRTCRDAFPSTTSAITPSCWRTAANASGAGTAGVDAVCRLT